MATTTPNFGWSVPTSTDLVKDGATAIETLGDSIDASLVDLKGGTTGQALIKASNTDMDFSWSSIDPLTILDAKGDLISATAADTPARLAVGANGTVLTADSTTATGLKWATAGGGGKVLQVVTNTTSTSVDISTTAYADTGLSCAITPTLSTSKILVLVYQPLYVERASSTEAHTGARLLRGATTLFTSASAGYILVTGGTRVALGNTFAISYLDSPATTSATTYKTQGQVTSTSAFVSYQKDSNTLSSMVLLEIGA